MKPLHYTHEQLINVAQITTKDIEQINLCRRQHNRLGFGYQLTFVRLANRFPTQQPFEIVEDILIFVSIQLNIPSKSIQTYIHRRQTISEHQEDIRNYLGLQRFNDNILPKVKQFIFEEACRLEQISALLVKTEQFLKEQGILTPSEDTLRRLIINQREEAKKFIFKKIHSSLSEELIKKLDELLATKEGRLSELQLLKHPPGRPSPSAMLKLTNKIEKIKDTGILKLELSWLNNNFQRSLTRYVQRCTATRLRELQLEHRYAVLVCFLWQIYRDTVDFIIDMYDKLINKVYNHAQNDIDNYFKGQRKKMRQTLVTFKALTEIILDNDSTENFDFCQAIYKKVKKEDLAAQLEEVTIWLNGKHSHVFNQVIKRFSYIRQFSPSFLKHLQLQSEGNKDSLLLNAVDVLRSLNDNNKRKLPEDTPVDFIPSKKLQYYLIYCNKLR